MHSLKDFELAGFPKCQSLSQCVQGSQHQMRQVTFCFLLLLSVRPSLPQIEAAERLKGCMDLLQLDIQTKANAQLPLANSLVHIVYKMKYSTALNHLTGSD